MHCTGDEEHDYNQTDGEQSEPDVITTWSQPLRRACKDNEQYRGWREWRTAVHRAEADEVTWDVYETTARRGVQQAARDRRRAQRGTRHRAARGAREQRLKPCEVAAIEQWLSEGPRTAWTP